MLGAAMDYAVTTLYCVLHCIELETAIKRVESW
jgi:hypothetical protein